MRKMWQTARVFISSTFRDMQAERDHLVRHVFPQMREELLKNQIHLVDVDLRWGVTGEESAQDVCRDVLDECRPFFLCMLGGRYGWVPPGQNHSITADEIKYGVLDKLGDHGHAFFHFRDPTATTQVSDDLVAEYAEEPGSDGECKLADLKAEIDKVGLGPITYSADWNDVRQSFQGLEEFGEAVRKQLTEAILNEYASEADESGDWLDEERRNMEAFIEERSARFVEGSRQGLIDEFVEFAKGGQGIRLLTGLPGSGKSALMSHLCRRLEAENVDVLPHFIGATAKSADLRDLLNRLCRELGRSEEDVPYEMQELIDAFEEQLKVKAENVPFVLLLDALDQLEDTDNAHWMNWLPRELPDGVRVITTALESQPVEILRNREGQIAEHMLEPLKAEDGQAITEAFLKRYGKKLDTAQLNELLAKEEADRPLYLLAALEELRTLGKYEEITDRITELPGQLVDLFQWIFRRIASEPLLADEDGLHVGEQITEGVLTAIACSRRGMAHRELWELLADGESVEDEQRNVSTVLRFLRPYLGLHGELYNFYHGQVQVAVEQAYLSSENKKKMVHLSLADYFDAQENVFQPFEYGKGMSNRRKAEELPRALHKAAQRQRFEELLWSYCFMEAKVDALGPQPLIEDYKFLGLNSNDSLGLVQGALQLSAHILVRAGAQGLPSQLCGRLQESSDSLIAGFLETIHPFRGAWLRPRIRAFDAPGGRLLRILEGHAGSVYCVAVTPDGCRVVSGSGDKTLKLWDYATGALLQTLKGHSTGVSCVAVTPDGGQVVSGSWDETLKLWNLESGVLLRTFEGHSDDVNCVVVTPDGSRAVSGSKDNTLKLWDLEEGVLLRTFEGHSDSVSSVSVTPDGSRAVSGSEDNTLKLWDLEEGVLLRTFEGHSDSVFSVSVTPDGARIVSGSLDTEVTLWDLASGDMVRSQKGHSRCVACVAVTPAGDRAVSGSHDDTLRVWDLNSGALVSELDAGSTVFCVAVTPGGSHAVAGTSDFVLKICNIETGEFIDPPNRDTPVCCLEVTQDGCHAVSGTHNNALNIWEFNSGALVRALHGHSGLVSCVACSPIDSRVISGSWDQTLKIWDLNSGKLIRTLEGHSGNISCVAVTPDGFHAISGASDNTLKVWNLNSGGLVHTLHADSVVRVVVTPDGRNCISSGLFSDKQEIWDLESGIRIGEVEGRPGIVVCMVGMPDGSSALLTAKGRLLSLWNLESGSLIRAFEGHGGNITCIGFTPGGNRLVSGAADKALKLWELSSGRCIATFFAESTFAECALASDDANILSFGEEGKRHLLKLEEPGNTEILKGHPSAGS